MSHRIVQREAGEVPGLADSLPPLLQRIYAARSVRHADELDYSLQQLIPADRLSGMAAAVDLLQTAMLEQRRIMVVGDFDADGATSCAVCVRALRAMGAADVRYLVPNRFDYGYGLTPEIVDVAARHEPWLVMTVDNGIASIDGVAAARAHGIRVLVTDHHLPGDELPAADAIVNPNQPGDRFPSKALAGVGVAFYVMLGLRAALRDSGWFTSQGIQEPNLARLLDLVALGTVADVVPLDANNRILVQQGVQRMRAGRCVPGIRALLAVGRRNYRSVVAEDLGFVVGPRLNAAGRLDDMSLGIECLLADDEREARRMAQQLDDLNRERREIEAGMRMQALAEVDRLALDEASLPVGLALFDPHWHQGVIGILAARIRERFHRPAVIFARGDGNALKGSARSIPGLHIRDILDVIATGHPGLVAKFGGHAMAAGLTIAEADLAAFTAAFDAEVRNHLSAELLESVVYSDGELQDADLCLETAQLLRDAGPWGQGFPAPVFDGEFHVLEQRVVGEKHLKMTLRRCAGEQSIEAIAFNTPALPPGCDRAHMAFRLDVNEFRGIANAQLVVELIERRDR